MRKLPGIGICIMLTMHQPVMAQKMITGFTDKTTIRYGDTIRNPKLKEGDTLMKFDTVVANPPLSLDKWGKVVDKEGDRTTISYDAEQQKF